MSRPGRRSTRRSRARATGSDYGRVRRCIARRWRGASRPTPRRPVVGTEHGLALQRRGRDGAIDLAAGRRLFVQQHAWSSPARAAAAAAARPGRPGADDGDIVARRADRRCRVIAPPPACRVCSSTRMPSRTAHQAALAIADAVDRDQALEAHAHHAIGRARRTGDRRGAAMVEPRRQQRRSDRVAAARAALALPSIVRVTLSPPHQAAAGTSNLRALKAPKSFVEQRPAAIMRRERQCMVGRERHAGWQLARNAPGQVSDWS